MVRHLTILITTLITCVGFSFTVQASPRLFTATYDVYEDDAVKAKLTSTLKPIGKNQYQLTDTTEGTAGLASLLNFKRTEQTDFIHQNNALEVIQHTMQQKVAFKSKHYEFRHQPGEHGYQGTDDDEPFQLNSHQPLLSNQLMSWQLTQQVCHNPKDRMQWPVLNSNQAKQYSFIIIAVDNNRTLVHRQYQNRPDKRTAIWINTHECYIEEIIYQKDDKVVRTVIKDIVFD
jgi:hypothetical protein